MHYLSFCRQSAKPLTETNFFRCDQKFHLFGVWPMEMWLFRNVFGTHHYSCSFFLLLLSASILHQLLPLFILPFWLSMVHSLVPNHTPFLASALCGQFILPLSLRTWILFLYLFWSCPEFCEASFLYSSFCVQLFPLLLFLFFLLNWSGLLLLPPFKFIRQFHSSAGFCF